MKDLSISFNGAGRCPDKCAGAADLQRLLTAVELRHVSIEAQHEVSAARGRGFICEYCGCVYIRDGIFTRRLGVLIGGWHSTLFPREPSAKFPQ